VRRRAPRVAVLAPVQDDDDRDAGGDADDGEEDLRALDVVEEAEGAPRIERELPVPDAAEEADRPPERERRARPGLGELVGDEREHGGDAKDGVTAGHLSAFHHAGAAGAEWAVGGVSPAAGAAEAGRLLDGEVGLIPVDAAVENDLGDAEELGEPFL